LTRVCFPSSSTAADAVATVGAVRDRAETDEPGGPREPPHLAAVAPGLSRTGGVRRAPAQSVTDRRQTSQAGPGSPRATRRLPQATAGCGEPQHVKELQSRMDQQASELKKFPEAVVKT
jgi:hypothetical protein